MLSRQSRTPSIDFLMLKDELAHIDPSLPVIIRTTQSEQHGIAQLIGPLCIQLWYACTSQVIVLDGYNPCVCIPPKRAGVCVIQLWHAVGAIKKFGYQSLDTPAGRSSAYAKLAHMHKNYDLVIAGGVGATSAFAQAFGYPTPKILPLGLPRLDALRNAASAPRTTLQKTLSSLQLPANNKRVVLYAPTLRKNVAKDWLVRAVTDLAQLSIEANFELIVSKHPLTDLSLSEPLPPSVHILQHTRTEDLIPEVDIVLTDYSALALEAGLVDVPAFFYVPDIKDYRLSPGLNIDPEKEEQLTSATHVRDLLPLFSNQVLLQKRSASYFAFIQDYFRGLGRDVTQSVASLIYGKLA